MTVRPAARTDVNRSTILAQRGAYGPASRAHLARVLSVSQLTKDLLAEGLLQEPEQAPSHGGRRLVRARLVEHSSPAEGVSS